tara:strand:- start:176 stop:346 length:171 start_codon:yes stop_codon:yes gene_type:complete
MDSCVFDNEEFPKEIISWKNKQRVLASNDSNYLCALLAKVKKSVGEWLTIGRQILT